MSEKNMTTERIKRIERIGRMEPERDLWSAGLRWVCGCDEAGAGPLAGPVYAAAVILCPPDSDNIPEILSGLDDSKKLSPKRREILYDLIINTAVDYQIAWVEPEEIDRTDILSASLKAMCLAMSGLKIRPDMALIDGNRDHGKSCVITEPHRLIIRGDSISASIAAASILAKVARDRYVCDVLDKLYPQYGFARHKGYGTKYHYEMLDLYGPCPAHRKSFLKTWNARREWMDKI